MKRKLCCLLLVFVVVLSCIGCGNSKSQDTESESVENETETENTIDVIVANTEIRENSEKESEKESTSETPTQNQSTSPNTNITPSMPQHTHSYSKSVTNPTCTRQGYTTYTCSCGDQYVSDYTAIKGHTEVIDKAVEATTTSTGLTEGKHCSVCGTVLVAQQVIPVIELSPADQTSFIIVGIGETYNYVSDITGKLCTQTYIESATYTIESSLKKYADITVNFNVQLVYPETSDYIAFRLELYDSNGVCVDTEKVFKEGQYGTTYSITKYFSGLEPGEYTLKIINY